MPGLVPGEDGSVTLRRYQEPSPYGLCCSYGWAGEMGGQARSTRPYGDRLAHVDRERDRSDDDREVDLGDDDRPVLPDQTRDDTDSGWGEHESRNDDRLREDRPPHYDDERW